MWSGGGEATKFFWAQQNSGGHKKIRGGTAAECPPPRGDGPG